MNRVNPISKAAIALTLAVATNSASAAAYCFCEHLGSQWDGLCEIFSYPEPLPEDATFSFSAFGNAYMPFAHDPNSPFGYYNVPLLGSGGLNFTVYYANGSQQSGSCALGT